MFLLALALACAEEPLSSVDTEIVQVIERWVPEESVIIELGSGPRTDVLAKKYKIHAVETDIERINEKEASYIYAPIANGWYDVESLERFLPENYQCVVVDGSSNPDIKHAIFQHLAIFLAQAPTFVFKGFDADEINACAEAIGYGVQQGDGFSTLLVPR